MTDTIVAEIDEPIYTSRIIKASALIADTRLLLSEWNLEKPVEENLARVQRQNIFGKASRRRVEDKLRIFRQRYFDDPEIGQTLVKLFQENAPSQWLDPLLYFFSAQNDRTLRDLVIEAIYPRQLSGYRDLQTDFLKRTIRQWISEGKTTTDWSEATVTRVARNAQATLRDFGVLQGKANKYIAPIYLPTPAFALIAHWLQGKLHSGNMVLHSEDWQLFFLPVDGVERFFIEAHQEHLLSYYAAGSVIRLEFSQETLPDYAQFLLERYQS
ncbi:MAG: hypothetical protein CL609_07525 [Anaerolineaceae bacterium]|nr:hypothetical protein [Anaerolineaceae bacterium]